MDRVKKALTGAALAASLGLAGAWGLVDKYEPAANMTVAYIDPVGIRTICRGTTGARAQVSKVTQAECDSFTIADLQEAKRTVESCIKVPLTQSELNAWVSFTLNVGPGGKGRKDGMCMLKSGQVPSHVRYLNAGNHRAACNMMMQWTGAKGKQLRGLYLRRVDETAMCLRDLSPET